MLHRRRDDARSARPFKHSRLAPCEYRRPPSRPCNSHRRYARVHATHSLLSSRGRRAMGGLRKTLLGSLDLCLELGKLVLEVGDERPPARQCTSFVAWCVMCGGRLVEEGRWRVLIGGRGVPVTNVRNVRSSARPLARA